jgi:hypothetical protein
VSGVKLAEVAKQVPVLRRVKWSHSGSARNPIRGHAIAQAVRRRPGSSPGQFMWDLWWTKLHCGRFSPSTSVSPTNSHSADCSSHHNLYHLELVPSGINLTT